MVDAHDFLVLFKMLIGTTAAVGLFTYCQSRFGWYEGGGY